MNKRNKILLIALLLIAGMFLKISCTTDYSFTGGTESGNARIMGTLYEPDGNTPAAGIPVVIRPRNFLVDTAAKTQPIETVVADTNVTNDSGLFTFEITLSDSVYNIEALSGNNAVLFDSVMAGVTGSEVRLVPRILKPSGTIKGNIELPPGEDSISVYVLVYGIGRKVTVGENGHFLVDNLAEAEYDLRIVTGSDRYGPRDTYNIPVFSADTTDLGTLSLPRMQIPAVNDVSLSYDTTMQCVAVTWSEADSALSNGYNVYRRNIVSDTVATRINSYPVYTTRFLDSTVRHATVYEYRVVAIGENGIEGIFGEGKCIRLRGGYQLRKTIETGIYSGVYTYNKGIVYMCDQVGKKIIMIDTGGKTLGCFGDTGQQVVFNPHVIAAANDTIYVVDGSGNLPAFMNQYIRYYDCYGNQLKKIICQGIDIISLYVVSGNEMYLRGLTRSNQDVICRLDSNGTVLNSLNLHDDYPFGAIMAYNSMIGLMKRTYDNTAATVVQWFNTELEYTNTVTIMGIQSCFTVVDERGNFYVNDISHVNIYDSQGELSGHFESGFPGTIYVCPDSLLLLGTDNKLLVFGFPDI